MLPMVAAVGCVIDFTSATMIKTELQAAADAASLATVSLNSPVITTAKAMSGNGTVSGGSTYATNFFNGNLAQRPGQYRLYQSVAIGDRHPDRHDGDRNRVVHRPSPHLFHGHPGLQEHRDVRHLDGHLRAADLYRLLSDARRVGLHELPIDTVEQARLMAVNPDNLGEYPNGCQFACHFTSQGGCGQSAQGPYPAVGKSTNPSPGGYCQGFTISRLGTTPATISGGTNSTNGADVNWNNTPVSNCSTAGTTSCIQLRADAVGYAVNALLSEASSTESADGISNQFEVGLFPFIQDLCTSSAGSSNSCSVGLTGSVTGSTITNFAADLANLLDTGTNTTLGSGGTHFENALSQMNTFITSIGTGSSASSALPYVFIVTDGSQDYQTQSNGNWGSQNWSSTTSVPYQNSATVMPPNSEQLTNYCTTMKNRGITVAILYIPYIPISYPNSGFASNEDGYANNNIANIPASLQNCASPNFFYTANTPTDINNALVEMFEQAVSTAHITN